MQPVGQPPIPNDQKNEQEENTPHEKNETPPKIIPPYMEQMIRASQIEKKIDAYRKKKQESMAIEKKEMEGHLSKQADPAFTQHQNDKYVKAEEKSDNEKK